MGHSAIVCRSSRAVETIQEGVLSSIGNESILLGTLSTIEQTYTHSQKYKQSKP